MSEKAVTIEELKKLPLRLIVAFAVRCALRAYRSVESDSVSQDYKDAVSLAISAAEAFANGSDAFVCAG